MTLHDLNRHMEICDRLKKTEELLAKLRASAEPQSPAMSDMPHAQGNGDRVAVIATEIADLEAQVRYQLDEKKASESEIRKFTSGISDALTRSVFNLRFVGGMSWKEVADAVGGSNSEGSVRQLCYRYLRVNGDGWNE